MNGFLKIGHRILLARAHQQPIVIHCRDCQHDIMQQLKWLGRPVRGVMHSFTGSWDDAEVYLALGLHLSFAGMLTYKNAVELRAVAAKVPLERVLVETDSPYLSPVPLRGKRNEPAHVVHTATCLAGLLGISQDELAARTTRNARELFALPASPAA